MYKDQVMAPTHPHLAPSSTPRQRTIMPRSHTNPRQVTNTTRSRTATKLQEDLLRICPTTLPLPLLLHSIIPPLQDTLNRYIRLA